MTPNLSEAEALTAIFRRHLENRDWQSARDVAHRFGERFPERPEASQFFNQVIEMEAAELYTLAARHGRRALAVLTVSDHLVTGEALPSEDRESSFRDMVEIALEAAFA